MPVRQVPQTDVRYYLVCFDEQGRERREPDGSLLSEVVGRVIGDSREGITDVFLASHGWKGDVPAAIEQYDLWVGEMVRSPDRAAAGVARPGFKAIVVGLHWPSLPFGDEEMTTDGGLLSDDGDADVDRQIEQYVASLGDTPRIRQALRTILTASQLDDGQLDALPEEVRLAYDALFADAFPGDLGSGSPGAPPGADHGAWDPDAIYLEAKQATTDVTEGGPGLLGGGLFGGVKGFFVAPLQQLSFWKMKDRGRLIGETGAHALLGQLQRAAQPDVHFHLMGHSFGCIVVSAAVAGPPGGAVLPRPVQSLFLVQGALSLWSFCSDIPYAKGEAGYFNRIVKQSLVAGPIVTTRSTYDSAVRKLYPKAAGLAGQLVLDEELPKFGGVGTFGAQGLGDVAADLVMQSADFAYGFKKKHVYNLEASGIIKHGEGFSGAHSDIAHPEVAHAMWQAALARE
jgi:hypothetical protein